MQLLITYLFYNHNSYCKLLAVLKSRKNCNKKPKWAKSYKLSMSSIGFHGPLKRQKINSKFNSLISIRNNNFILLHYFKSIS